MGGILSLPIRILNFFLPFTNPNTPLLQDIIHTLILCVTLYFAPQIGQWLEARKAYQDTDDKDSTARVDPPPEPIDHAQDTDDPPLDERLVFQEEDDDDDDENANAANPPPLAPTPPPPNAPAHHNHHQAHVEDDLPAQPQQPHHNFLAAAAGPANEHPRPTPANRTIGAKKAKSLARKDQRRAYHEFHRQEAELRKLQEAEGAEEREAALLASRERRARIEEEIREKEREERERVKREREREADEEGRRRERCLESLRWTMEERGCVDVAEEAQKEGKDVLWVERLVRASGLLAQLQKEGGGHVMLTGHGWLVSVDEELMRSVYEQAEAYGEKNDGKVGMKEFEEMLEKAVLAR